MYTCQTCGTMTAFHSVGSRRKPLECRSICKHPGADKSGEKVESSSGRRLVVASWQLWNRSSMSVCTTSLRGPVADVSWCKSPASISTATATDLRILTAACILPPPSLGHHACVFWLANALTYFSLLSSHTHTHTCSHIRTFLFHVYHIPCCNSSGWKYVIEAGGKKLGSEPHTEPNKGKVMLLYKYLQIVGNNILWLFDFPNLRLLSCLHITASHIKHLRAEPLTSCFALLLLVNVILVNHMWVN